MKDKKQKGDRKAPPRKKRKPIIFSLDSDDEDDDDNEPIIFNVDSDDEDKEPIVFNVDSDDEDKEDEAEVVLVVPAPKERKSNPKEYKEVIWEDSPESEGGPPCLFRLVESCPAMQEFDRKWKNKNRNREYKKTWPSTWRKATEWALEQRRLWTEENNWPSPYEESDDRKPAAKPRKKPSDPGEEEPDDRKPAAKPKPTKPSIDTPRPKKRKAPFGPDEEPDDGKPAASIAEAKATNDSPGTLESDSGIPSPRNLMGIFEADGPDAKLDDRKPEDSQSSSTISSGSSIPSTIGITTNNSTVAEEATTDVLPLALIADNAATSFTTRLARLITGLNGELLLQTISVHARQVVVAPPHNNNAQRNHSDDTQAAGPREAAMNVGAGPSDPQPANPSQESEPSSTGKSTKE